MRTTVNLGEEAYRLARALAVQRRVSVGQILSDALLTQVRPASALLPDFSVSANGLPIVYIGRTITPEDVAAAIEVE